jgi:peptide/nickel transport system substrate-binding protein
MSSRRGLFGLCAALMCAALAAVGCGGKAGFAGSTYVDRNPLPVDTMTVAVPEIGRYGGRFVIGQTAAPRTFNSIMANETSTSDVTDGRLFTSVADFDNATQQDVPMFAKSWDTSPDGLTWTFHLRHDAKFSDGHPMTAEDVMFSVQVIYDPVLHPSMQDLLKAGGKPFEFSAPDSYTIVVKTAATSALLVPIVGSIRIMPKHILERSFKDGSFASAYSVSTPPESIVCSGPWRLKQFVAGEKTVLERNPYWFGVDPKGHRLPYLDELVFRIVPDQNTAALQFLAGDLDGLDNVKPEDYKSYQDQATKLDFTLYDLGPALTTNFFWFNLNTVKSKKPVKGKRVGEPYLDKVKYGWFSKRDFRRAVSMAVDRDALIRGPLYGYGLKNWASLTAGNKEWYAPEVTGDDYNPEESRRLLANLGFKDQNGDGYLEDPQGHTVSFTMKTNGDNAVRMAMCNFIRDDLSKVGIKCIPSGVDFNTLVTNVREDFQYESLLLGLSSGVPPDPGMSQNVWRSSGPTHYWNIRQEHPETEVDATLDRLMDANLGTLDLGERKRTSREMQELLNRECLFIWLPTLRAKIPISNRFGNLQPSVIPHRILWNIDRVYQKKARVGSA